MYLKNRQTYNTFVYECDKDKPLKSVLLDDMKFSIRAVSNIKKGKYSITVNDDKIPKNHMIREKDIIKVKMYDDKSDYVSQEKDLSILFEDDDIIIFDKPAGIVSHPTKSHLENTMLNYAQCFFEKKNIESKVRFISRLDMDTSGIITIAKNAFAHYALSQGFLSDKIQKRYTAIVSGDISRLSRSGTIAEKIEKSEDGIKRVVSDEGQDAITHYKIVKKGEKYSVLELLLETGRTHQIRVHLSHMGLPIVGDELYGGDMSAIRRQALHCHSLEIISPRSMEKISVTSPYPKDMQDIIDRI